MSFPIFFFVIFFFDLPSVKKNCFDLPLISQTKTNFIFFSRNFRFCLAYLKIFYRGKSKKNYREENQNDQYYRGKDLLTLH